MTNARSKRTKARDPLPEHFNTIEEAAEFWDTHSTTDYEEYFKEVDCQFDIKKRTHLISIDGAVYDRIRAIAKKKRIPADKLVSRWIKEKLRSAA
ncbi:MAG TPA: CopG family antitoxin [Pyrinomonadaceae bacterium]|nr:CopG family antitoxin [Pyrinomonadaceae bacterium]